MVPTASTEGKYHVVIRDTVGDEPDKLHFYSSHDVEADAQTMAAEKNEEQKEVKRYAYSVVPNPGGA